MFYDNSTDNEYAIRISYDSTESLSSTRGTASEGQWVYVRFVYNPARANDPELLLSSTKPSDETSIILGRVRNNSGTLFVDTTDMEMVGPGYSYPNPSISSLDYSPSTGSLTVNFSGYFQTNDKVGTIPSLSTSGISVNNAYQIYIDQTGTAKIRAAVTGNGANMGKTILAYKDAGATAFVVLRYSNRAELTADSLTLQPLTPAQSNDKLANIYTDADSKNSAGEVILSKVVQRLVAEVQKLRTDVDKNTLSISQLGGDLSGLGDTVRCSNLVVTSSASFAGSVSFNNANLTFSNTNFGSRTNPIPNLYVSNVLYATQLQYMSN